METPIIILLFMFALCLAYLTNRGFEREINRIHKREMNKLSNSLKIASNPDNKYQFYTNGHSYVWVKSSYSEIVEGIKNCCRGPQGVPIEPIYFLLISESSKKVYFVGGKKNFDFSKLKHYEEWLQSNKSFAEKIAKHKNS